MILPSVNEKNFGDFIERGGGIEMVAVANDVVAFAQQFGEVVFLENLEFRGDLLDFSGGSRPLWARRRFPEDNQAFSLSSRAKSGFRTSCE